MTHSEGLCLRPVEETDRERLWLWANDAEARAQSFQSAPIAWEEHCRWFDVRLLDPNWHAWIGVDATAQAVGVVRFLVREGRAEIGVTIAPMMRGQGFGRLLIIEGCAALFRVAPVLAVDAYIKPGNAASLAAFRAAGFLHQDDGLLSDPHLHWVLSPSGCPGCP